MLPSKGYFNDIECPYLDNTCGRPYCHFNHRKKQLEIVNEVILEESSSKDFPTYKPTPKSELAIRKSHIPISYVPDVYKVEKSTRSFRNNIVSEIIYKPTPISLLNSAVTSSANNVNSDVSVNNSSSSIEISSSESYDPKFLMKSTAETEKIIHESIEKYEYKPAEQETEYLYNPTSCKDINEESLTDIVYKPNSNGPNILPKVEYTPSACSKPNVSINFENLDSEFNMIDEIINMSDTMKIPENHIMTETDMISKNKLIELNACDINAVSSNSETDCNTHINKISSKSQNSTNSNDVKISHEKVKSSNKDRGSLSKDNNKKERKDDKQERRGDRKDDKQERRGSKKDDKQDRRADRKDDKQERRADRKDDKQERRGDKKEENEEMKKERKDEKISRKEEDKKKSETKVRDRKKNDSSKRESNKNSSRDKKVSDKKNNLDAMKDDKSDFDKKNKSKQTGDKKESGRMQTERDENKHAKHKSDKHKHDKKDERRPSKREDKIKKEISIDSESKKRKTDSTKSPEKIESKRESPLIYCDYDIDIDIDAEQTMEECFKIFNEYKATVVEQYIEEDSIPIKNDIDSVEESAHTKKRIAHSNAFNPLPKFQQPKLVSKPSPGQVMTNRFKIIKAAQADNEEKLITNELRNAIKRPQPMPLFNPAKKPKLIETKPVRPVTNTSLIDEILNRSNSKPSFKKIAPVSNVMNMQKAKANLKIINKQTTEQLTKTIAQTNKTGKRSAHVPDYSLSDIPDVIDVDKSKLPVNVRTRFLTLLADECCKLYLTQKDAYKRALDEEYSCYQKCKVLVTYRNSAMLAVNRLRKEVKEREENNMGPIGSDDSSQVKKGNAEKISLYNKIQQYILTNDELDIHGYPRESRIPGRATIKNRKVSSVITLPRNQKKCCRCSKIYLIGDDGKAIYEEECLYHPLRKRTIRGEHIYLCCKTSDDSGCVTCHTHVCETPEDAELDGFQTTLPPNGENDPRSNAVYALDCEMCYTTKGLELTRVTVIDTNCKTVYESFVKPLNEIVDYNTRFSGITKQQMDKTSTGILQVQANILHLCNSNTILIGHSLESDMKALKIIHSTIVDTAVLFPHKMGLPHKRALRTLACDYLKKIIQNDVGGHDSAEDAITCMELIKWKVKEDGKFRL